MVYAMRSIAVHTGIVAEPFKGKPSNEWLRQGYSLTADTARRFIQEGVPNWDSVTFG
jgi:hypothetical protein